MATTTDIHVRVDSEVKDESERILKEIGLTISDLVNMALRKTVRERGIPFETKLPEVPENMRVETREDVIRLIDEAIENDNGRRYSIEEVRNRIEQKKGGMNERRKTVRHEELMAA